MSLSLASAIATGSLGTIQDQIGVVSRNIAGANTPGYSAKKAQIVNGVPEIGNISRAENFPLLRRLLDVTAGEGGAAALAEGVAQIQQSMNIGASSAADSTSDSSPASAIKEFASALQKLSASPADATVAGATVAAAKSVVQSLNDATKALTSARQQADESVRAAVVDINQLLAKFKDVNNAIVAGTIQGSDVTDKLDERDQLLQNLSAYVGVRTIERANNDMVVYTDSGVTLFETTARSVSFQGAGTLSPGAAGGAVYVDGVPISGDNTAFAARAGKIVGLIQLRDQIAPQFQSQLDELARGLIVAFSERDQVGGAAPARPGLFAYSGSITPSASLIPGLAGDIKINATVDPAQGGNVMLLRDGGIAAPGNPAYVYNKSGASGYSARIQELIGGLSAPQAFDAAAGLGSSVSVTSYASSSIGWLASQAQRSENAKSYQGALLQRAQQSFSGATGVNLGDEMAKMLALENSYQASTRLLATINAMYSTLLDAIRI